MEEHPALISAARAPLKGLQSLPLHEALCEAIERGDADAAEQAALILIAGAEEDLRELVPARATGPRNGAPDTMPVLA